MSLEQSSVCVIDASGSIVREAKVASEPEALAAFFVQLGVPVARIGLEAGPLSPSAAHGGRRCADGSIALRSMAARRADRGGP